MLLLFQILSIILAIPYLFIFGFLYKIKKKTKKGVELNITAEKEADNAFKNDFAHLVE